MQRVIIAWPAEIGQSASDHDAARIKRRDTYFLTRHFHRAVEAAVDIEMLNRIDIHIGYVVVRCLQPDK